MSKPNQLFLLADHIKLSLLERQRAQSLNLDGEDSQDGHISRSLEQFREGLDSLKEEEVRLREAGDKDAALTISDSLPSLQKQLDDLTSQFHGFSSPSTTTTLTHPNDPSLQPDFTHASTLPNHKPSIRKSSTARLPAPSPKTVRFTDSPQPQSQPYQPPTAAAAAAAAAQPDDASTADLFGRYRDDPDNEYTDQAAAMSNEQIHAYHSSILEEQDDHLDRLGESISRQRELSMQMGDELEAQVELLDETDGIVDRHVSRLDRAQRQLGKVARAAGESKQMMAIIILIVVLVMLIAILK